jgi:mannose-1-phosphate guanylyltransferase
MPSRWPSERIGHRAWIGRRFFSKVRLPTARRQGHGEVLGERSIDWLQTGEKRMLHAVIMAGGAGTRFWPASRMVQPKQLLGLAGERTMLQATVDRLGDLVPPQRTMVVTNRQLVEPVRRQLPQVPAAAIIGEPCKRDTAPCIGLAAGILVRRDPEAVMLVAPADHVISPDDAFQDAIRQALKIVDSDPGRIITFGIRPTYPAESFGYIERGLPVSDAGNDVPAAAGAYPVARFREKPDIETARQYLAAGNFYWNSGIFVWRAQTILDALRQYEPQMYEHLAAIAEAADSPRFGDVLDHQFEAIVGKSIDFAVMEHYDQVSVIEAPFQWDDVGSWQALARLHGTDEQGNTLVGRNLALRTTNTIVRSDDQHLVVTLGVDNLIVVHTPDATLVVDKDDEQSVREAVKLIEQRGWAEYL